MKKEASATMYTLDRLLGWTRRTAFLAACAVFFLLLEILFPNQRLTLEFFIGLIFAGWALWTGIRGKNRLPKELAIDENAAEYVAYLKKNWRFYRAPRFYMLALVLVLMHVFLRPEVGLSPVVSVSLLLSVMLYYVAQSLLLKPLERVSVTVVPAEESGRYDRLDELKHALVSAACYWVLILGAYIVASISFRSWMMYLYEPILGGAIFLLFCLVSNPFSRYATIRRRRVTVRMFRIVLLLGLAVAVVAVVMMGALTVRVEINGYEPAGIDAPQIAYDADSGVYTIVRPKERELRILQLTDIHISGGLLTAAEDRQAVQACECLIRAAKPDLVVVTGDLAYPLGVQTLTHDNAGPIANFAGLMERLEVPWVFIYGNHDTEKQATKTAEQLNDMLCRYYSIREQEDADKQLLMADVQPQIYGRYNQIIRIEDSDGELERLLFLMDSNDYADGGYDNIHEDQVQWYEETVKQYQVPSFVFIHIPFHEYQEADAALKAGAQSAEYLFGENREEVSMPVKRSRIFETIRELGSTQAVFCGHDHINTLGVRYQGVDLVYGMSIDYLAYAHRGIVQQSEQRGGTLILCDEENYSISQLSLEEAKILCGGK